MSSLTNGLSNLFSSLFEILSGILNGVFSAFQSVFGLGRDLIASVFDLMSGVVGFIFGTFCWSPAFDDKFEASNMSIIQLLGWESVLSVCEWGCVGNIVIIGVLVAAYVGYSAYRQKHQGGGVTAGMKKSS